MRPHVICHMCSSIEGRILVSRWPRLRAVGSGAELFERTAASIGVPAWLVGSATLRVFAGRFRRLPGGVVWVQYRVRSTFEQTR